MREAHLRDFIAVIETGSVRAAARKLGLSQAAVSKNLTALERSLGVPLLIRSNQGIEPTEYGKVTLLRARIIDAELRRLQDELHSLAGGQNGWVCVGLSATAEALLLPEAIKRFHEKNPHVIVSLMGGRSLSTIAALRESRVDFAVGPTPPDYAGNDLNFERLFSNDLGVVMRANHPLAHCATLQELVGLTWAFGVRRASGQSAVAAAFQQQKLPPPRLGAHCDSSSALVSLLMHTDMAALTSLSALEMHIEGGALKVLPIDLGLQPVVQYLMTPATRPLTTVAAHLATEFRRSSRRLRR